MQKAIGAIPLLMGEVRTWWLVHVGWGDSQGFNSGHCTGCSGLKVGIRWVGGHPRAESTGPCERLGD